MQELSCGEKRVTSTSSTYLIDPATNEPSADDSSPSSTQVGVVLTRQDYYTVPPINELQQMVDDGSSRVEDLIIGRTGCGEILFPGTTDVAGLNLDSLGEWKGSDTVYM